MQTHKFGESGHLKHIQSPLKKASLVQWDVGKQPSAYWQVGSGEVLSAPINPVSGQTYSVLINATGNAPSFDVIYDFNSLPPTWDQERLVAFYYDGTSMRYVLGIL